jgi:hypothetical protein
MKFGSIFKKDLISACELTNFYVNIVLAFNLNVDKVRNKQHENELNLRSLKII